MPDMVVSVRPPVGFRATSSKMWINLELTITISVNVQIRAAAFGAASCSEEVTDSKGREQPTNPGGADSRTERGVKEEVCVDLNRSKRASAPSVTSIQHSKNILHQTASYLSTTLQNPSAQLQQLQWVTALNGKCFNFSKTSKIKPVTFTYCYTCSSHDILAL
ncbi:hypothetical protein SRHO_G00063150 [Serrasalmus rhombeus]